MSTEELAVVRGKEPIINSKIDPKVLKRMVEEKAFKSKADNKKKKASKVAKKSKRINRK